MPLETKLPKVGTTIFTVMSQLAAEHGAVNLGQGFPDFAVPQRLADELAAAMAAGHNQYASMTGGRGMERLLSGTVRNYLPPDWQALERALNGIEIGYSALSRQVAGLIDANAVLTPDQLARLSDQEREQLETARRSAALLQATSRQALDATGERFTSLQRLIDAIPAAEDQKAVLDLQARISAEQAMLQNEQTKLMVLHQAAQAEEAARRQRASELAISNIGSLRRLPAIGLNE